MIALLKALLASGSGVSMMRAMSLLCCLSAVGIAIYGLNKPIIDYSGLSLLCGTFLTAAFTGKILQKRIEKQN